MKADTYVRISLRNISVLFFHDHSLLKFRAEGWEFAKILRSLEQFDQTVKGQNNFY